jgi:hypothetical protein
LFVNADCPSSRPQERHLNITEKTCANLEFNSTLMQRSIEKEDDKPPALQLMEFWFEISANREFPAFRTLKTHDERGLFPGACAKWATPDSLRIH